MMIATSRELLTGTILQIDCCGFSAIAHVVNCRNARKFMARTGKWVSGL